MHSIATRLVLAVAVAAQAVVLSSAAEARFGRGAAFVGGAVVGGAVVAGAARSSYYYGAPAYGAPVYVPPPRPLCGYYPYPPCY